MNEHTAIELENLTVCYGRKTILKDVSLRLPHGSVYALLGRNGSGKTSAIRCIMGQQKPTSGGVRIFGLDSWKHRARVMERVGFVPEDPNAPPGMTARQLTNFCSKLYRTWEAGALEARLRKFAIPMDTAFGQLSRGQRCQVTLSLALAPAPDLLILDDPTLGLDPVARREFFEELIGELADRGITVLITTHDLAGVEGIATHVGILKGSQLAVNEEVDELKSKFRRIRYTGNAGEITSGNALLDLSTVKLTVGNWGIEAVVSNYDDASFDRLRVLDELRTEINPMSLEEIFSAVVSDS